MVEKKKQVKGDFLKLLQGSEDKQREALNCCQKFKILEILPMQLVYQ